MTNGSSNNLVIGQCVIIGGLGVQLIFFGAFIISSVTFHVRIIQFPTQQSKTATRPGTSVWPRDWRGLLFACYTASLFIVIRSVYRLIEFAQGNNGYVISHEVFLYVLDAAMMFMVMAVMNVFHPSLALQNVCPLVQEASFAPVDTPGKQQV